MHKVLGAAVGCAVALAVGQAAAADAPRPGFYVGLSAGGMFQQDIDVTAGGTTGTFSFENGFNFGAALGYRFGNGFRVEGEFNYGRNSLDNLKLLGVTVNLTGDTDFYTFTGGVYYDFNIGMPITPYLGVGAGVTYQNTGTVTGTVGGVTATLASGGDSTDFAAFGEIGFSYALSNRVELVPSYRFLYVDDGGSGVDNTLQHIVKLGLRISF